MTTYGRAAYGASNPNAGKPANGDFAAWGGYKWPNCAPANLMSTTDYTSKYGQRLRVQLRSGIVPLAALMFAIADKHNYVLYGNKNGENWGPWGMECRAISGTSNPSGHSGGLAMDWNAPNNPYSTTFQSDMPPAMVADIESCGWFWGGRYVGQKYDPMHFSYCWPPGSVAGHLVRARAILGNTAPPITPTAPTPVPTPTEEDEDMLKVIRNKQGVDYVYGPNFFDKVETADEYFFYSAAGLINTPHGQAPVAEQNLIDFIETQVRKNQVAVLGTAPAPAPPAKATTHTVQPGETLGGIAKAEGVALADLQKWNNITDPNNIQINQVLRLTSP